MRRSLFVTLLTLLLGLGLAGPMADAVYAHAHLDTSIPAEGAVVPELPETVVLKFTEPVELRSSVFKVYPLATEAGANQQQLNADARALFEQVLPLRRDEDARVDAGIVEGRTTADEIQIVLQEDVAPGPYVVMWRVLSVDTHVVSGFYVFTYEPLPDK